MDELKNEIVVYRPNETVRLNVRLENETVWLTQCQMGILSGCTTRNVRLHLENIYLCGDLTPSKADSRLTDELKSRAEWLGLEFLDHIILGSPDSAKGLDCVSLAEVEL